MFSPDTSKSYSKGVVMQHDVPGPSLLDEPVGHEVQGSKSGILDKHCRKAYVGGMAAGRQSA